MDDQVREAERAFEAAPGTDTATGVLQRALRARRWPDAAGAWLLDLGRWDGLDPELQELTARCAEAALAGEGFRLTGLVEHELGGLRHRIATFDREGVRWVLCPGGRMKLGLDVRAQGLVALAEDHARRADEAVGFMIRSGQFTPPREVLIAPLLVEAVPRDHDLLSFQLEDDPGAGRLPTSDEWEHLCGGGSSRLYRWGDAAPDRQSPYVDAPFDLHRRLNAFGLALPGDTYCTELCAGDRVRGGDSGCCVCGGHPHAAAWLTLASAFDCTPRLEGNFSIDEAHPCFRLVRSLGPTPLGPAPSKAADAADDEWDPLFVRSIMAIVSKAVFEEYCRMPGGRLAKPGDVLGQTRYVSTHRALEPLHGGGDLYLVTVRPGEALWLVGMLERPTFTGSEWTAKASSIPVTDISDLRPVLRFTTGQGMTREPGKLGMSLQTPRTLTPADVRALRQALERAPTAAWSPVAPPADPARPAAKKKAAAPRKKAAGAATSKKKKTTKTPAKRRPAGR